MLPFKVTAKDGGGVCQQELKERVTLKIPYQLIPYGLVVFLEVKFFKSARTNRLDCFQLGLSTLFP